MFVVHFIIILTLFGYYAAYEKFRRNASHPSGSIVPVSNCCEGVGRTGWVLLGGAILLRLALAAVFVEGTKGFAGIPAMLTDLYVGFLLLQIVSERFSGKGALWFVSLYLFNPAVVGYSGIWGQNKINLTWIGIFICLYVAATESSSVTSYVKRLFPDTKFGTTEGKLFCVQAAAFLSAAIGALTVATDLWCLYPAMLLVLLCYAYSEDSRYFDCYVAFTVCNFYKITYILYIRDTLSSGYQKACITIISALTIASVLYFCRVLLVRTGSDFRFFVPEPTEKIMAFGYRDVLWIGGICLLYGCIAFHNLGSRQAPVTEYSLEAGESIVMDFGKTLESGKMNWYLKDSGRKMLALEIRNEGERWKDVQEVLLERAFAWGSCELKSSGRYVRLTNCEEESTVMIAELVFQDEKGAVVTPKYAESKEALFDETALFKPDMDYQDSSYFDEIYYTRTAYEFLNGTPTYEITHPPLGKSLIALGVMLFGTTPFGFRFVGTLFGVLMLPFLYLLGRDITKSRGLGGLAGFLFAFDFMHFTQTRLTTIDVFITFFTILMYFFMYRYSKMSFYDTSLARTFLPLGMCGVSFGLAIACKWTGFYAGVGLAVVFFYVLYLRYQEYRYALKKPQGSSSGISHAYIVEHFWKMTVKTIAFCVVFFLVIPFVIYLLSYLPFSDGTDSGLFARMWKNQAYMFHYHTELVAEHPYASSWYQWPTMIRPVFYYSKIIDDTMRQGISAFGNPLVWWTGILAFVYMVYLYLKKQDKPAGFLCVAYLSCYLPWCFVTRYTFAYHYFPCVPFVVCMIVWGIAQWRTRLGERKFAVLVTVYGILAFLLFVLFYPVISGKPVSVGYVDSFLRWMDTWVLVQ